MAGNKGLRLLVAISDRVEIDNHVDVHLAEDAQQELESIHREYEEVFDLPLDLDEKRESAYRLYDQLDDLHSLSPSFRPLVNELLERAFDAGRRYERKDLDDFREK